MKSGDLYPFFSIPILCSAIVATKGHCHQDRKQGKLHSKKKDWFLKVVSHIYEERKYVKSLIRRQTPDFSDFPRKKQIKIRT